MIIPSIVRIVRSLFRFSARTASRTLTTSSDMDCKCFTYLTYPTYLTYLTYPTLFVPQRLDRIESRGLTRRVPPEKDSDGGGDAHREEHGTRGNACRPPKVLRNAARRGKPHRDADDAADDAERDGFDDKLRPHVAGRGAD